jgi:hypothetical protein
MFEDILPYLPSPQTIAVLIAGLLVLSYITIYFGGRLYNRQGFTGSRVIMEDDADKPYATTPIMKLADYDVELDVVANLEGSKEESDERVNKLLSARPYDWSSLPPAARTFQEKQANWLLGAAGNSMAAGAVNFGAHVKESFADQPPDYDSIEEEEQKILATYVPEKSANLSKYSAEDVNTLIERIYKKRGLVAEVKEAPNGVYEVVSTRPINEKVLFEDELEANVVREGGGAAATIQVPTAAAATAAGLDPYYEPQSSMRTGRSQYMQWTPGLERMFAPTYDKVNWY